MLLLLMLLSQMTPHHVGTVGCTGGETPPSLLAQAGSTPPTHKAASKDD